MPAITISFLLGLIFVFPNTALGDKVEDIFSKAGEYTVKIKSELRIPFMEDIKGSSSGAGFVVDKERGWIMTNAHVANYSPSEVTLAFREGDYSKAQTLYVDPYIDVAILKIPDGEAQLLLLDGKHKSDRSQTLESNCTISIFPAMAGG